MKKPQMVAELTRLKEQTAHLWLTTDRMLEAVNHMSDRAVFVTLDPSLAPKVEQ